jgi:hypothetical protein
MYPSLQLEYMIFNYFIISYNDFFYFSHAPYAAFFRLVQQTLDLDLDLDKYRTRVYFSEFFYKFKLIFFQSFFSFMFVTVSVTVTSCSSFTFPHWQPPQTTG